MINKKNMAKFLLVSMQVFAFQQITMAQNYNRVFNFKQGDLFETEVITTSNAIIKRGKQVLNLSSTNNITKSYTIDRADDKGYNITVKISKMKSAIDANKVRTSFNSEAVTDTASNILKGLYHVVNRPIKISVNKNGAIQDFDEYKLEMASDTLISFAGLQSEIFKKDALVNFFADFTYNKDLKKGYSWTENKTEGDQKSDTRFVIDYVDEKVTILNFFKTANSSMLNTNSNGTYVIDNNNGLITEKYMYIIAVGYQLSAGKVLYAVSRSTSIVEKTKKLP